MKLFTTFENCDDGVLRVQVFTQGKGGRRTVALLACLADHGDALQALRNAAIVMTEPAPHVATQRGGAPSPAGRAGLHVVLKGGSL